MSNEATVITRVGRGASARAAVAVVLVTLAVIVGVAFVNRPPPPPPVARLAVVPAATPTPAGLPAPTRTDTPVPQGSPFVVNLGDDAFAAIGLIGGRQYPIVLADRGDGTLAGAMRLPFPRPDMHGTVELAQLWNRAPSLNFQSIGRWSLPLDLLMPESRRTGTVLTVEEVAGTQSGNNRLVRQGFHMEIRLESRSDYGMIFVTVETPFCGAAGGTACIDKASRHRVYGEDGIFGLPGWPWRADDAPAASPTPKPSRYVFNWRGMGPGNSATR